MKNILNKLQLLDIDGNLSFTGLMMWLVIGSIGFVTFYTHTFPDWTSAAIIVPILLNYGHKRHVSNKYVKEKEELEKEINFLKHMSLNAGKTANEQDKQIKELAKSVASLQEQIVEVSMSNKVQPDQQNVLNTVEDILKSVGENNTGSNPTTGRFF